MLQHPREIEPTAIIVAASQRERQRALHTVFARKIWNKNSAPCTTTSFPTGRNIRKTSAYRDEYYSQVETKMRKHDIFSYLHLEG